MSVSKFFAGSQKGLLAMVAAAVLFSLGGVLCKMVPWNPLAINGIRNLIAFIMVSLYMKLAKIPFVFNRTTRAGAVFMVLVTTLFVMANKMTTAANAIILQYTSPVWIVIFSALFLKKKPARLDLLCTFFVLAGVLCFFADSLKAGSVAGDLIALLSGIFYALLFMMNSFKGGDAISAVVMGQGLCALLFSPFVLWETDFSAPVLMAIGALGLFQVGLGYILFSYATKHINPLAASMIGGLEPILNPLLVALCFQEMLGPMSFLGAVIVMVTLAAYSWFQSRTQAQINT